MSYSHELGSEWGQRRRQAPLVIFDLYGTLVDWRYSISKFIEYYISPGAVEDFFKCDIAKTSSQEYKPYKQFLCECLSYVAEKSSVFLSSDLCDAFVLSFAKSPPFPDTVYGLKLLKRAGYTLVVLSNTDRDLVKVTLAGMEDLVDYVITAEDVGAYKPSTQAFVKAYAKLGVEPLRVIHVSAYPEYDLLPASRLGARTILLDRGLGYDWPVKVKNLLELHQVLSTEFYE